MRSRYQGGVAVAVVSAGFAVSLAGCGPVSLASSSGKPQSSPSQSATAAMGQGSQGTTSSTVTASASYSFRTLDDPADVTFNQLLGINNRGVIAGYFGSGAAGHPNKGYALSLTHAGYTVGNENFPGSVQTQVTGLNDHGVTVGFWSGMNNSKMTNDNTGFYAVPSGNPGAGFFRSVRFPASSNANPPVNQLLGVNNSDVAVGFYTDAGGNNHGYTYSIFGGRFHSVKVSGVSSLTATAINNFGDVAGFAVFSAGSSGGATDSFLRTNGGHVYTLAYPGASMTQAFGVNDFREVVGTYTAGTGSNAATHGFTWSPKHGFQTVDDPQGQGATTINGVNDEGDLVGFYTDSAGNTDGFGAAPSRGAKFPGLTGGSSMAIPTASPSSSMAPSMAPTTVPSSPPAMPTSSMPGMSSTQPTPTSSATMPAVPTSPANAPSTNPLTPVHW